MRSAEGRRKMLNPTREQVAIALFNLLSVLGPATGNTTFAAMSRRPVLWTEVPSYPAFYLGQPGDEYLYLNGTASPPQTTLNFDGYLYTKDGLDPNVVPDTAMNNLIDAIENTIMPVPSPQFAQTLGGIVDHVWIDKPGIFRRIDYSSGQGIALLTIKVMVPQ